MTTVPTDDLPRCGAFALPDGSCCWRVWAPRAERVDLVLDLGRARIRHMTAEPLGYFSHVESDVREGQVYAYRLDDGPSRPDPASLWQPDGVHLPSAVLYPERFFWTDAGWKPPRRHDLVIYELHVGRFTTQGTFDAVIPRLDSLVELGVTALEIMPVTQFPGDRNWGYDGVHLYAPQNTYGGPHGLQRLVDACHARGLAVLLDVVYNHFGPEGNYVHEFGPYFSDRYRTSWGPPFNYDGPGSDPVRQFVLDNVRLWVGDYHMDGLRLDAVHAIHDRRPRHILQEIKQTADEAAAQRGATAHVIAESLMNDVRMVLPPERGGYGLDAEWDDDFHQSLHAHLTGERHNKYVDFGPVELIARVLEQTFVLNGTYSRYRGRRWGAPAGELPGDRFVVSMQDHDHVGNRARGERLAALLPPAAQRLCASLKLLAPYLPLLFMGEEYGEENPFLFFCSFHDQPLVDNVRKGRRRDYALEGDVPDPQAESTFASCRLRWSWPEGSVHAGLRRLYQDLLAARRHWPALQDFRHRTARLLPADGAPAVLELVRGDGNAGAVLRAYFNVSGELQPLVGVPGSADVLLFDSEAARYGGKRDGADLGGRLLPHECVAYGRLRGPRDDCLDRGQADRRGAREPGRQDPGSQGA
jgi:maltooligosyltrehalose trehalohydrolase